MPALKTPCSAARQTLPPAPATGVTPGDLLEGVRFFGEGARTHSLVMSTEPRYVRFVDTIHIDEVARATIRF